MHVSLRERERAQPLHQIGRRERRGSPGRRDQHRAGVSPTPAVEEPGTRPEVLAQSIRRIETEYTEMPGLSLTLAQAQRLLALDRATCERALRLLTARGLLRITASGRYVRAG